MALGFQGPTPRLFGHRGAAGVMPENTLGSFRRARDDGADVLELDVHASADGEIVVIHDATLDRTTDATGPVRARPWAELARLDAGHRFTSDGGRSHPFRGSGFGIPRLADLIDELPDVPLNIEIKQAAPSIVAATVELVRRSRARVVLAAEDDAIMREIRERAPDLPTSASAVEVAAFVGALREGRVPVVHSGLVALQIPPAFGDVALVTAESVAAAHGLGVEVHVWTINEPDEMRRLLALGCDGIMSDLPARARAVIAEARARRRA
jgi:glycerophosphoryl diester phosphodiesterase